MHLSVMYSVGESVEDADAFRQCWHRSDKHGIDVGDEGVIGAEFAGGYWSGSDLHYGCVDGDLIIDADVLIVDVDVLVR